MELAVGRRVVVVTVRERTRQGAPANAEVLEAQERLRRQLRTEDLEHERQVAAALGWWYGVYR